MTAPSPKSPGRIAAAIVGGIAGLLLFGFACHGHPVALVGGAALGCVLGLVLNLDGIAFLIDFTSWFW